MDDKYQKLYESLKTAYGKICFEVIELEKRLLILETEKRQWEAEKIIQNTIVHAAVSSANATSNGYLEENKRLKEEIKRLQGTVFINGASFVS